MKPNEVVDVILTTASLTCILGPVIVIVLLSIGLSILSDIRNELVKGNRLASRLDYLDNLPKYDDYVDSRIEKRIQ